MQASSSNGESFTAQLSVRAFKSEIRSRFMKNMPMLSKSLWHPPRELDDEMHAHGLQKAHLVQRRCEDAVLHRRIYHAHAEHGTNPATTDFQERTSPFKITKPAGSRYLRQGGKQNVMETIIRYG